MAEENERLQKLVITLNEQLRKQQEFARSHTDMKTAQNHNDEKAQIKEQSPEASEGPSSGKDKGEVGKKDLLGAKSGRKTRKYSTSPPAKKL